MSKSLIRWRAFAGAAIGGALLCIATAQAAITPTLIPRLPHEPGDVAEPDYGQRMPRVVVKFHDGSGVRGDGRGRLAVIATLQDTKLLKQRGVTATQVAQAVQQANSMFAQDRLLSKGLFDGRETDLASWRRTAERSWGHEVAELGTYVQVPLPRGGTEMDVRTLVGRLNALVAVEIAYAEPAPATLHGFADTIIPAPPPVCPAANLNPAVGDLTDLQGYAHPAPVGVDIAAAHAQPGGRGDDVRIIDIEGGFTHHSDLPVITSVGHPVNLWRPHGTAVLGILGAKDNGLGTTGLAPDAHLWQRSIYNNNLFADIGDALYDEANVANHIYWAGKHSLTGVVLLELQRFGPEPETCDCATLNCRYAPVEYWPAEFDVIQTAVGNGVIVVEAAGNGGHSLDDPAYDGSFDRNVRDSGALIVTGAQSDGVTPLCDITESTQAPNYGERVDVHAWGEDVVTTAQNGDLFAGACTSYMSDFGGSSSASAIVAGTVGALQGVHVAATGEPMAPASLIEILVDSGTPQAPGPLPGVLIGPQPNLGAAVPALLEEIDP
jgi:serine protease